MRRWELARACRAALSEIPAISALGAIGFQTLFASSQVLSRISVTAVRPVSCFEVLARGFPHLSRSLRLFSCHLRISLPQPVFPPPRQQHAPPIHLSPR